MTNAGELALGALRDGARTSQVGRRLDWSTGKARYQLLKLERAGRVRRLVGPTRVNDFYWVPTGAAA